MELRDLSYGCKTAIVLLPDKHSSDVGGQGVGDELDVCHGARMQQWGGVLSKLVLYSPKNIHEAGETGNILLFWVQDDTCELLRCVCDLATDQH